MTLIKKISLVEIKSSNLSISLFLLLTICIVHQEGVVSTKTVGIPKMVSVFLSIVPLMYHLMLRLYYYSHRYIIQQWSEMSDKCFDYISMM